MIVTYGELWPEFDELIQWCNVWAFQAGEGAVIDGAYEFSVLVDMNCHDGLDNADEIMGRE